ncbi:hydroxymethylglutaryl-CoA lyase [Viridibacillus sp. YIM B01967]|uniref:Hydroxymethylglutaryl-CoA lyase n=1 Tax=Viridibacillus soli TaxID=2798301 RepID=A0ABS1H4E7_9BACL|nr:hydroxymethylglutaryl-CoA lyase [Viridibacillus soli]MBK3494289.1 hydroxymethylglutaryl-CoA lyase [Viridibacillus soli]
MFSLPNNATIIEVGPRDGLQNEKNAIATDVKLNFIKALQDAGISEMELTSFVSPKWVPQMADAEMIVKSTTKVGRQFVLAPNATGVERAMEASAEAIAVFVGVSNSFNKKNINKNTAEAMARLAPVVAKLKDEGKFVRACISTAFYCPYEGKMEIEDTVALCKIFASWGVDELSVADTIGMANPVESYTLFKRLKKEFPELLLTAHFHDTRKMALANIFAALQAGIDRFDTSTGGLGGCPFAKGATGNVATEDVVHMLESIGIHTGVDIDKICQAAAIVEPFLSKSIDSGQYRLFTQKQK